MTIQTKFSMSQGPTLFTRVTKNNHSRIYNQNTLERLYLYWSNNVYYKIIRLKLSNRFELKLWYNEDNITNNQIICFVILFFLVTVKVVQRTSLATYLERRKTIIVQKLLDVSWSFENIKMKFFWQEALWKYYTSIQPITYVLLLENLCFEPSHTFFMRP